MNTKCNLYAICSLDTSLILWQQTESLSVHEIGNAVHCVHSAGMPTPCNKQLLSLYKVKEILVQLYTVEHLQHFFFFFFSVKKKIVVPVNLIISFSHHVFVD
jgi:hypothetical protein